MSVFQQVSAFLGRNKFPVGGLEINSLIDSILYDMEKGLDIGYGEGPMDARQPMIPTWGLPPKKTPQNTSVIVIDAGGTNFRSCLVSFDESGVPTISHLEKCSMPGIERELSKDEFFDAIAENLEHLKNLSDRIGFCFSYEINITPDGDGEVISFSKEIKAKSVVGSLVGKSLSEALVKKGWKKPERIVLLNDTTAALQAGAASKRLGAKYSSYVGFILGTGMNAAYIESEKIKKVAKLVSDALPKQIVVCESGAFDKLPRSDFDVTLDNETTNPGRQLTEKMCSGAYLGPLSLLVSRAAASEGLFSSNIAEKLLSLEKISLYDVDQFLYGPYRTDTVIGSALEGGSAEDYDTMYFLLDAIIERSARLSASIIAACVIKSGEGHSPVQPVCILCNGTTFYKTHGLQDRVRSYLLKHLTEERHIYFEIVSVENDITLGTAIAALSN